MIVRRIFSKKPGPLSRLVDKLIFSQQKIHHCYGRYLPGEIGGLIQSPKSHKETSVKIIPPPRESIATLPEINIFTLKKGWLEDDPFLLGWSIFQGYVRAMLSFWEGNHWQKSEGIRRFYPPRTPSFIDISRVLCFFWGEKSKGHLYQKQMVSQRFSGFLRVLRRSSVVVFFLMFWTMVFQAARCNAVLNISRCTWGVAMMMMMPFAEICWRSDGVGPPGGCLKGPNTNLPVVWEKSCDARVVGLQKMVDCIGVYIHIYIYVNEDLPWLCCLFHHERVYSSKTFWIHVGNVYFAVNSWIKKPKLTLLN